MPPSERDRRRISEPCAVVRPTRPALAVPAPLPLPPPREDDTDENEPTPISVSRTRTPADETLTDLLDRLKASADAAVPAEFVLALERVAQRGAEDRLALEAKLAEHVEAAAKRQAHESRWRRIMRVVRGVGVGAVVAALGVVARALIAHGDAAAVARQQTARVEEHGVAILRLRSDLAESDERCRTETSALRAQAAADHALLSIFAARLSAATP